jgi:hypothetical protein
MGHIGTALYKKVAVWLEPVKGQMTPVDLFLTLSWRVS